VWTGYATPLATRQRVIGRLRTLPGPGATMAAPVWQAFMKTALANVPPQDFVLPEAAATPGAPTTTTVPPGNESIFKLPSVLPKLVTMPALTPGDTDQAASKARKAGLRIRRVNVAAAGVIRGQVLVQSPPAGTKLPSGSEIVIEATAGEPPPKAPIPNLAGHDAAEAKATLERGGWTVTVSINPAPPGFAVPSTDPLLPPAALLPGQVWALTPDIGQVSPDGNVIISVQP
jgi:hypothetical protein